MGCTVAIPVQERRELPNSSFLLANFSFHFLLLKATAAIQEGCQVKWQPKGNAKPIREDKEKNKNGL